MATTKELTVIDDAGLAETITRILDQAEQQVLLNTDTTGYDDKNMEALVAFQAIKVAEDERHNLRSMQAWIAVRLEEEQTYLAYPPTEEYPEGFGSLSEFLQAAGISSRQRRYELGLVAGIQGYLGYHGYDIYEYLNQDRYPKLINAAVQIKNLATGKETEFELDEIMKDVETAQSRDDIRKKYREAKHIAYGAVNHAGDMRVLTVVADEEAVSTLIKTLQSKVDWSLSATAEEKDSEIVVHALKEPL